MTFYKTLEIRDGEDLWKMLDERYERSWVIN